jgi:sulfide:quinone oxidoreductase
MATSTLILGAGFGGLAAARTLRALAPDDHRIIVVDRAGSFHVGAAKNWVMLGDVEPDEIQRPIPHLLPEGVEYVRAEIQAIDAAAGVARTASGSYSGDFLVVALGANLDFSAIPGLDQADTFYSLEGAIALRSKLAAFERGHVMILTVGKPYKCPPAPYEAAMLLHEHFEGRGVRRDVRLSLYSFEGVPLMTAGPEMGAMMRVQLAEREIGLHLKHVASSIDPQRRVVQFENGSEAAFDLLLAVPPHRVPEVVREAGLTDDSGWIPVDPRTLQMKRAKEGVPAFAIGDITKVPLPGRYEPDVPLALPKAGVMAAAHGEVVARRIAATLGGNEPSAQFDGRGFCYIETGRQEAVRGGGDFFALPSPKVEPVQPNAERHREKMAWVEEWLTPRR